MAVVYSSLPLAYTLMFHILSCRNSKILAMQVNLMCSMRNRKRRHSLPSDFQQMDWTSFSTQSYKTSPLYLCIHKQEEKRMHFTYEFIVQIYVLQKVISYSFTAKLAHKKQLDIQLVLS
uniref:Uncharacterized protein n=1 Tax=Populus davidiana TaxID=266767 RepID=A0A6M2EH87_9ROSI